MFPINYSMIVGWAPVTSNSVDFSDRTKLSFLRFSFISTMEDQTLKTRLEDFQQDHLLAFDAQLNDEEKETFYKELDSLDLNRIKHAFEESANEGQVSGEEDGRLEPIPASIRDSVATAGKSQMQSWREAGRRAIANNKVAVLLLAGGQGTRLNSADPKGMYSVGLLSKKTLYQIQAERILKLQELAKKFTNKSCVIPWYIMTSEYTHERTQKFFEKHNFFGLEKENIVMFEQDTFPCLTMDGKIILQAPGKIAKAPDGNGGLYKVLGKNNVLRDMERRGIENIHVYCVDNILVKIADPVFIGFCLAKGADCGAKVVEIQDSTEKVGVICRLDGRFQVVEYSEISLETAQKRDSSGHLVYNAGNICNHFFTLDFLKNVVRNHEGELKPHVARKKIPCVDDNGECTIPTTENGIKLEKFIFDVFQFSECFAVLQVIREEEFSPVKNAPDENAPEAAKDTPETARDALCNLHYQYIVNAGGKFMDDNEKVLTDIPRNPRVQCEISPLLSYDGEGLEEHVNGHKYYASQPLHLQPKNEAEVSNGKNSPNNEPTSKKARVNGKE